MSDDAANHMLKKWCTVAGIEKKITMHKLRATAACALAKNDIPLKTIMKQLGHTNGAVTQRYLDAFEEDQKKATNVLDNMF
jgi:integrase